MWSRSLRAESVFKKRSIGTAPLPSEKRTRRLLDIIDNAEAVLRYTAGMNSAAFYEDRKTYHAVERCMEGISEAAAKLGEQAMVLMPDQRWHDIRALGNVLRHEYDEISHVL